MSAPRVILCFMGVFKIMLKLSIWTSLSQIGFKESVDKVHFKFYCITSRSEVHRAGQHLSRDTDSASVGSSRRRTALGTSRRGWPPPRIARSLRKRCTVGR